jgi:predicted ArsR family transcriptional regulator
MIRKPLTDPGTPSPEQRGRRAAVLQLLRESQEPLGAAELAQRAGVHLNTARFHLDALVADGRAVRDTLPRDRPGRPKVVYAALAGPGSAGDTRSFQLLSHILLGIVSSSVADPEAAATEAGRAWGRYLTESPAPTERIDADEAQRRIVTNLDRMGFVPDVDEHGRERRLRLHHCPFREVAQRAPSVVCAVHLGLMQGTIAELGAPLAAEGLIPFVEPHLCVATLRRTDADAPEAPGLGPVCPPEADALGQEP